tara:strand:- start:5660 stop:5806 length:147 start_codon:yes stop_codon:yes gene_type:complete
MRTITHHANQVIVLLVLLINAITIQAQNLVPNHDFGDYSTLPNATAPI